MQQEIEIKLGIPQEFETELILGVLEKISVARGFRIAESKVVNRTFQYYDTSNLDIYMRGETLRRVGGFNPNKDRGVFRYDFKIGPVDDRYEKNYWTNKELQAPDILTNFGLIKFYEEIFPSAYAKTRHHKMKLVKSGTVIEATLDYFCVVEGGKFCELELEFEHGDLQGLMALSETVQTELCLERMVKQKYCRVIESMQRYKTVI